MSPAEEAEQEAAVFEDDVEDDSDTSDDSEDDDDGQMALPTHPQPELPSLASADLNASTPSIDAAIPNPNFVPKLNPIRSDAVAGVAGHSQNGVIPIQVIPAASPFNASFLTPVAAASVSDERRSLAVVEDDSRRLFQRLWTDEEEIKILQGFLEFTSRRGTTFASHQYDTGPFYEEIKKQFHFEFTKSQLIEKLRRLKKKYRNCDSRMQAAGKGFSFRSAHERAIYDIARKIWSASTKRAHDSDDEDLNTPNVICNEIVTIPINDASVTSERRSSRSRQGMKRRMVEEAAAGVPDATPLASSAVGADVDISNPPMQTPLASSAGIQDIIEKTVKNCFSPLFKGLIDSAIEEPFGSGLGTGTLLNFLPLSLGRGSSAAPGMPVDEKWRTQQILELEVYLKRLELVKDHIKSTLAELKSAGS